MDIFDILLAPIYLCVIIAIAYKYSSNKLKKNPVYKYFLPGLTVKIIGAISLGLVYSFYYTGGDTINYYNTSKTLLNIFLDDPDTFYYVYFEKPSVSEYYLLSSYTSEFNYWVNDKYAYFVAKCFVPILLIAGKSYMAAAVIIATICYMPVWWLFLIFTREFPTLESQFKWAILFTPSVVFWGSGMMKDSITLASTCLYVHGFYWFFTQRRFKIKYLIALLIGVFFLVSIKPYILFALLPGSMLWFVTLRVVKIKNTFLKFALIPAFLGLGLLLGVYILGQLGDSLGAYSMEKVIGTASGAQQDLKQSYYGGNSFNIGDYEPTPMGLLSVSHKAIFATLFRPTVLDVRNIVMFVSALENTFILGFCLYLLFKLKVFRFFGLITLHPMLMFSFIFSIFFAFSVGVSISNFGTLVRLKIPFMPFFLSSLVIMNYFLNLTRKNKIKNIADLKIQKVG
ncbi:MAG: hypothetical protein K0S32_2185 [Bacteroidetes bacterium]|jgi:hypothetical protein|nr:hypothetical protein [Bacteroidota bacterium]